MDPTDFTSYNLSFRLMPREFAQWLEEGEQSDAPVSHPMLPPVSTKSLRAGYRRRSQLVYNSYLCAKEIEPEVQ